MKVEFKDKKVDVEIVGYDPKDYPKFKDGGPLIKETINLKDFNGMLYAEKANVFVKGTIDGAATIVASKKGKSGYGNIYQTDDLKYKDDISKKPGSENMLGLVAEQDIRLQYNSDTKGKDIISQASMFAYNGSVGPDDKLVKNDGKLKEWKILGGIIASDVRVTADYNSVGPYRRI